jgi:hypothetical protein
MAGLIATHGCVAYEDSPRVLNCVNTTSRLGLAEGLQSGLCPAQDQGMHIMGAFVSVDRL